MGRSWPNSALDVIVRIGCVAETYFGDVRWSHLVKAVEAALPQDAKRGLTKPFYLLFWRLTFSDICSANTE